MFGMTGGCAGQPMAVPEVVMQTSPSPGDAATDMGRAMNRAMTRIIVGSRDSGFLNGEPYLL